MNRIASHSRLSAGNGNGESYTSRFKKNNCPLRDGRDVVSRRLTGSLEALVVPGIAEIWIVGVELPPTFCQYLGERETPRLELSHALGMEASLRSGKRICSASGRYNKAVWERMAATRRSKDLGKDDGIKT